MISQANPVCNWKPRPAEREAGRATIALPALCGDNAVALDPLRGVPGKGESMMRRTTCAAVLGMVFCAVSAATAETGGKVVWSGKVLDAQSRPVAAATVEIYEYEYVFGAWGAQLKARRLGAAKTQASGEFSLPISPSPHTFIVTVVARKEGAAMDWASRRRAQDEQFALTLTEGKTVAGTVVDEKDRPIPGAKLRAFLMGDGDGGEEERKLLLGVPPVDFLSVKTDAKGRFEFQGVPAGTRGAFGVTARGRAGTFSSPGSRLLPVVAGRSDIKIALAPEARISGVVVDKKSRKPVPGVRLVARSSRPAPWLPVDAIVTDGGGVFAAGGLPAGSCVLGLAEADSGLADWVAEPVRTQVEAGKTKTGLALEVSKGALLEVTVTDAKSGAPVKNAMLTVQGRMDFADTVAARSGPDGVARLRLRPREGQMGLVRCPDRYKTFSLPQPFGVKEGQTLKLVAPMEPAPRIRGVVRDPEGKPVQGATIKLLSGSFGSMQGRSGAEGRFEIVAGGDLMFDPMPGAEQAPRLVVVRAPQRNLAAAVELEEDVEAPLDIKLSAGAKITGKVVDPGGKAIPNAMVTAMIRGYRWGSSLGGAQKTDPAGRYEVKALPAGQTYRLSAGADGYGHAEVEVKVPEAPKEPVEADPITLKVANLSISGTVTGPDGAPAAGVRVSGYGEDQPHALPVTTDAKGRFKIDKLCEGEVNLLARDESRQLTGYTTAEAGDKDVEIRLEEAGAAETIPSEDEGTPEVEVPDAEDF